MSLIDQIATERPTGSAGNEQVNALLEKELTRLGYAVTSLSFDCVTWQNGGATLEVAGRSYPIRTSPYSAGCRGEGELLYLETADELNTTALRGKVLVLGGALTEAPLQPKDYPFYYPDEHKVIIDRLEAEQPLAIIAVTGRAQLCGLDPFPLFEDGSFTIPSAYLSQSEAEGLLVAAREHAHAKVAIDSAKLPATARQLVACKPGRESGKIVIAAHMDAKNGTPAALDNAAGVALLLAVAARVNAGRYAIEIVPFNGEEYYAASGEVKYLAEQSPEAPIRLMINIDSPLHAGAGNAVSFYNLDAEAEKAAEALTHDCDAMSVGPQWYAGDHCAFAFSGTPCAVIASDDLFAGGLDRTHTPEDTLDNVSLTHLDAAAAYTAALVQMFMEK